MASKSKNGTKLAQDTDQITRERLVELLMKEDIEKRWEAPDKETPEGKRRQQLKYEATTLNRYQSIVDESSGRLRVFRDDPSLLEKEQTEEPQQN